jgi:hypothetical protein
MNHDLYPDDTQSPLNHFSTVDHDPVYAQPSSSQKSYNQRSQAKELHQGMDNYLRCNLANETLEYKVRLSREFGVGRVRTVGMIMLLLLTRRQVLKLLWAAPAGEQGSSGSSERTEFTAFGQQSDVSIRRFIIVKTLEGHSVGL